MEAWQLHQRLSQQLSPGVKLRIRRMAPRYLERAQFFHDPQSLYREALTQLRIQFPTASHREADVLATYLLGVAAAGQGSREALDSLNEIGESEALRLQMAMDRMSKLMSTLSNLLKKTADTQNAMVQNIK